MRVLLGLQLFKDLFMSQILLSLFLIELQYQNYEMQFPPYGSVIKRNASGHVIGYSGKLVEHFDWLSKSLGFE
jgi:hypothetical protein